jgi:hypothetical protein
MIITNIHDHTANVTRDQTGNRRWDADVGRSYKTGIGHVDVIYVGF